MSDTQAARIRELEQQLAKARELVKSKTPATLTQSQAERMPPEKWVSWETHQGVLADCDALRRELEAVRWALSFAASVIKSGEPWTTTCDEVFGKALAARTAGEKEERDAE